MVPPDPSLSPAVSHSFLCILFLKLGFISLPFVLKRHLFASVRTFGQALVKPPASDSLNINQKVTQGHTQMWGRAGTVRAVIRKPIGPKL